MRKIITYTCLLAWIGCASPATDEKQSKRAPIEDVNTRPAISESQLASKKDPVCGMPEISSLVYFFAVAAESAAATAPLGCCNF